MHGIDRAYQWLGGTSLLKVLIKKTFAGIKLSPFICNSSRKQNNKLIAFQLLVLFYSISSLELHVEAFQACLVHRLELINDHSLICNLLTGNKEIWLGLVIPDAL